MPPALIAQLILQFGIPATRDIVELLRSKADPSLDDWLQTLNKMETNAQRFLLQTASLEASPAPTP